MGPEYFHHRIYSANHLSIAWTKSMQFVPPYPASCRSILILSSHLLVGPPSSFYPSGLPAKTLHKYLHFKYS